MKAKILLRTHHIKKIHIKSIKWSIFDHFVPKNWPPRTLIMITASQEYFYYYETIWLLHHIMNFFRITPILILEALKEFSQKNWYQLEKVRPSLGSIVAKVKQIGNLPHLFALLLMEDRSSSDKELHVRICIRPFLTFLVNVKKCILLPLQNWFYTESVKKRNLILLRAWKD